VIAALVQHSRDRQRVAGRHKRCARPELHQADCASSKGTS
jgi:hypothetical protein